MSVYTSSHIAEIVHGNLIKGEKDNRIEYLLTDSRKLMDAGTTLFFALDGFRRSAAPYVEELYTKGVRNFVVSSNFACNSFPGANFIQVDNVLRALQNLATWHRSRFSLPVIGITGSNGKTIVKEWLNQLLEKDFQIIRSPKSYNSQVGVPLSVWQINATHTLGIFEAGISQPGEMQSLQTIIQPAIGVLTHIGDAHGENFNNLKQKIEEKLLLFKQVRGLIAPGDNLLIAETIRSSSIPCIFWGKQEHCGIRITGVQKGSSHSTIRIQIDSRQIINLLTQANQPHQPAAEPPVACQFQIPFTDDASIENAIICFSVLLNMGYDVEKATAEMHLLKPVEMRLELKKGINNCSVINDSYIADISSLRIALDFLEQQQQHPRRTVILSDFAESNDAEKLYHEIAGLLQQKGINRFIGIGSLLEKYKELFQQRMPETNFFASTNDFIRQIHNLKFHDETILIKGARTFALENISSLLEQKAHQTVLEVNLSSIVHNLKEYQRLLKPSTKIMVMVKAFSYGSGSYEIANILQFHNVDYLAVAYADEGVELRKAGISLPIMVMNPEESSFHAIIENSLEPELFSFNILASFIQFIRHQGLKNYPIHLKIDTGMHRLGFELHEIERLVEMLKEQSFVKIQSVFSHLAGSEDPTLDDFTQYQAAQYRQACALIQERLSYSFMKHISNSAAIVRHPELQLDMVRLGIGIYGADESAEDKINLIESATLKTTIAQIKTIKAGESVGYGRTGKIVRDSVIATIRIGYADGFRRNLSNGKGKVYLKGKLAPVTGRVAMDMTMIDITGISDVREGDEVIIFGEQLPVTQLAKWADTIPYEILAGISQRVQRIYFEE